MLIVTTAATVEPVTATEAKQRLRITHSSDDTLLESLITSAREEVELASGRALAAAAYRWASEEDESDVLRLPLWPVDAVTAVSYEDADGVRQTMDPADYSLDADRSLVSISSMPDVASRWSVSFEVDPQNVPGMLRDAIILRVGDLYNNPEASMSDGVIVNPTFDRLVSLHRVNYGV